MKAKITKRLVDTFRAEPVDCTVFDTVDLGFVLRVRKTGGVSYAVEYKAARGRGAPTKRVTIGRVGKMTPEGLAQRPRSCSARLRMARTRRPKRRTSVVLCRSQT